MENDSFIIKVPLLNLLKIFIIMPHNKEDSVENPIESIRVKYLIRSNVKIALFIIASVMTAGIVTIWFYWFKEYFRYLYNDTDDLEKASHVSARSPAAVKDDIVPLQYESCKLMPHKQPKVIRYFIYKEVFHYFGKTGIKPLKNTLVKSIQKDFSSLSYYRSGLSDADRQAMHKVYGVNLLDVKNDPILLLIMREVLNPYTFFQVFSLILWYLDDYWLYSLCVLMLMLLVIIVTVYENFTQGLRMKRITYINEPVTIVKEKAKFDQSNHINDEKNDIVKIEALRYNSSDTDASKEESEVVKSITLAIGDIVHIKQGEKLTADIFLLDGRCLTNEAMLTGESVPVIKRAYEGDQPFTEFNFLYAGTETIMAEGARGIVINTGFYTKKGEIIRALLFTEHKEFKFKTDSLKILAIITGITLVAFIALIIFIRNSIYTVYYDNRLLVIKSLEMFTVSIPPVLPLSLVIGFEIASARLKRKKIFTLFLDKINQAGRVKLCCFDKTGTLTENTLKLRGIQPLVNVKNDGHKPATLEGEEGIGNYGHTYVFDQFYDDISSFNKIRPFSNATESYLLYEAFSTCHSLQKLEKDIVGDPIEVQLFDESGFSMEHKITSNNHALTLITPTPDYIKHLNLPSDTKLVIEKAFDFTSDRKRMSVVISVNREKRMYLKGAPEIVKTLCTKSSLPSNYDQALREFTEQGYRVLSMAYKNIDPKIPSGSVDEQNLTFMGFVIFDNPLKPESKGTLETLKSCGIRNVIITGDNLLTALSVGISLELFNFQSRVFIGQAHEGKVAWEEIENEHNREIRGASLHRRNTMDRRQSSNMSQVSLHQSFLEAHGDPSGLLAVILKEAKAKNCVICITGEAFDLLFENADMNKTTYQRILNNIYIYARTSPNQKAKIVAKYQQYNKIVNKGSWFVSFCGDGANDSEALKQADISMSLTTSEALLAATFNTTRDNVSCLIDLFIEAKCSLETSIQNAKFILYYSVLQFIDILLAYIRATEYSTIHYFYWDLYSFLPLSFFISYTSAVKELNSKYPARGLINRKFIISLAGHIIISLAVLLIIDATLERNHSYLMIYEMFDPETESELQNFFISIEARYFFTAIMNVWVIVIFCRSYPFKQNIFTNYIACFWIALVTFCTFFITYTRYLNVNKGFKRWVSDWFAMLKIEHSTVDSYVVWTMLCLSLSLVYEMVGVNFLVKMSKKIRK